MSGKYAEASGADVYELPETQSLARSRSADPDDSGHRQRFPSGGDARQDDPPGSPDEGEPLGYDMSLPMPAFMAEQTARKATPSGQGPLASWSDRLGAAVARLLPTRLARFAAVAVLVLFLLLLASASRSVSASRLREKLKGAAQGWGYTVAPDARIFSHTKPRYDDPFNPDDLTFTEQECDAYFPGLWREVDRSVEYFTRNPLTKEYLESACDDPAMTHMRVKIFNNRLYLKDYKQSDFSRTQAALALLQQSIVTSREPLPNVEFCIGVQDWPGRGKFGLDRAPETEDVWLMPDYGFWSWPEHVGSYHDLRRRIEGVEHLTPWEEKHPRLLWRGNMAVGTDDRKAMIQAAQGYPWNDIKAVDWDTNENTIRMEDHCKWKFQGFADGNSYSGRLRYLQNCKTVIVTHNPRWLQHWTHLYNGNWKSPDQNIVLIPYPENNATVVNGTVIQSQDRLWERLPETMNLLLKDDARAKLIAENQWNFFRNRYISPASATCYWRKAIKGYGSVQNFTVDLAGTETSYESWILRGLRTSEWREGIQRRYDDEL